MNRRLYQQRHPATIDALAYVKRVRRLSRPTRARCVVDAEATWAWSEAWHWAKLNPHRDAVKARIKRIEARNYKRVQGPAYRTISAYGRAAPIRKSIKTWGFGRDGAYLD